MSTKTLRKRIALTSVVALAAGLLSVVSVAPASAYNTDYVFDVVPSGSYNQVAYTESGGVEYSTFVMSAGATEKITLSAVTNPGEYFTAVNITGGTGTFTGASRTFKTGTAQDPGGMGANYCAFSSTGTATASSASGSVFGASGSDVELLDPEVPSGYDFDGTYAVGALCGEWLGAANAATVTIPATAAGQITITVTRYDDLSSIDIEQRITVNVLPAASTESAMTKTYFSSDNHEDSGSLGNEGYGVKDGAGVIYSPARSGYLVGRFGATQFVSNGNDEVDATKAKSMEWSITGPGCIRSWEVGNNQCLDGVSVSALSFPANYDNSLNVRLVSTGTPGTTTLTLKVGGVVVKTYTVKFFGQAHDISFVAVQTIGVAGGGQTGTIVSDNSIANNEGNCGELCIYSVADTNDVAYGVVIKDALGTPIPTDDDYLGAFGNLVVTSSNAAVISDPDDDCFVEDGAGLNTVAVFATHCQFESSSLATSGQTANAIWTVFNNDGTTVTKSLALTIGGAVKTVTVAFDKNPATYTVGEKSTFTVTAKDASGNPVYDGASILGATGLVSNLNTGGTLAAATSVGGKATYKLFAPVVPGAWTISGTDVNGVALSATATIVNANDARLASLITKINALTKLIKKIQKKVGVK